MPEVFCVVPPEWQVIVTDIQGSTKAVAEGRYRDVNTIAASCVIACLNIAKKQGIQIPFFYGGDGATLLVPPDALMPMLEALRALRQNVQASYGLPLRVGSIPVQEIYAHDKTLSLAKWSVAPGYDQAICLGDGLSYADKRIKAKMEVEGVSVPAAVVDLQGLTCRWNEIKPRDLQREVVCLMVQATSVEQQAETYVRVLDILDEVYGTYDVRHPVATEVLSPSVSPQNASRKGKLQQGRFKLDSTVEEWLRSLGNAILFKLDLSLGNFNPKQYLQELIAATDTLHLAGTLFTLVVGTSTQREQVRAKLDELEEDGQLIYGTSSCPASVMTCYVQKYDQNHVHFLDGAGGGYTQASKEFKAKLRARSEHSASNQKRNMI